MTAYLKFICRSALVWRVCHSRFGDTSTQSAEPHFQFGLIGDVPYTTVQQQEYQRSRRLNKADLAFVVHIGDFQNDPEVIIKPSHRLLPASMTIYRAIYDSFQSVRHPFI